jgi:Family of unknown function (DUF5677)
MRSVQASKSRGVSTQLVYRCIARRAEECLSTVLFLVSSPFGYVAPMVLRPLCEDLIFGRWLSGLAAPHADRFVQLQTELSILRGLDAQEDFLPRAYAMLAGDGEEGEQRRQERSSISKLEVKRRKAALEAELKALGAEMKWKNTRPPSIGQMAVGCGLTDIYEFFYHGTSKAVHADLHQMGRMVWGTPGSTFTITSSHLQPHYELFSVAYGVWLTERLFDDVLASAFPEECSLIDEQARSVWLALVLVGLARNNALPPLVTKRELDWRDA